MVPSWIFHMFRSSRTRWAELFCHKQWEGIRVLCDIKMDRVPGPCVSSDAFWATEQENRVKDWLFSFLRSSLAGERNVVLAVLFIWTATFNAKKHTWVAMDAGCSHLTVNTGLTFCCADSSKVALLPQTQVCAALRYLTPVSAHVPLDATRSCTWLWCQAVNYKLWSNNMLINANTMHVQCDVLITCGFKIVNNRDISIYCASFPVASWFCPFTLWFTYTNSVLRLHTLLAVKTRWTSFSRTYLYTYYNQPEKQPRWLNWLNLPVGFRHSLKYLE